MSITSRIIIPPSTNPNNNNNTNEDHESIEDIFTASLTSLFTDTAVNSHGDPGSSIIYKSPRFGDVLLKIPADPDVKESQRLFATSLWNAALVMADAVEVASCSEDLDVSGRVGIEVGDGVEENQRSGEEIMPCGSWCWTAEHWDVRGCDVLELGAGTALPSIIAIHSNAKSVTITDHPSSPALTTHAIQTTIKSNIKMDRDLKGTTTTTISSSDHPKISVYAYTWGDPTFSAPFSPSTLDITTSALISTSNPESYPEPTTSSIQSTLKPSLPNILPPAGNNQYHRIIIADCLWMPSKHASLIRSILLFLNHQHHPQNNNNSQLSTSSVPSQTNTMKLKPKPTSTLTPCALITAGYHTGRGVVSDFFRLATGQGKASGQEVSYDPTVETDPEREEVRGTLKIIEIFEVNVDGGRREWRGERPGEMRDEAKKWCVCAVLVRR